MSVCAVVRLADNEVAAMIVADESDPPYEGTMLVDVAGKPCAVGWIYDPVVGDFIDPNPPSEDEAE